MHFRHELGASHETHSTFINIKNNRILGKIFWFRLKKSIKSRKYKNKITSKAPHSFLFIRTIL